MPHGSRLSPDGRHHYSVAMMSDELYEIDATTFEIKRRMNLVDGKASSDHAGHDMSGGMNMPMKHSPKVKPTWVYPHPTEPRVYVAHNGANEVSEVDLKSWTIIRRFKTGKGPYNLEVSPDGKFLVVSYKSDGATGIWDLKAGKELASFPNSRKVTHGVTISPDSRYAFVSVEGKGAQPGAVDVFDLRKLEYVATAEMGKQAGGIAFWKMDTE
jgi:DNA-binding beta-propeller fold protein YncE